MSSTALLERALEAPAGTMLDEQGPGRFGAFMSSAGQLGNQALGFVTEQARRASLGAAVMGGTALLAAGVGLGLRPRSAEADSPTPGAGTAPTGVDNYDVQLCQLLATNSGFVIKESNTYKKGSRKIRVNLKLNVNRFPGFNAQGADVMTNCDSGAEALTGNKIYLDAHLGHKLMGKTSKEVAVKSGYSKDEIHKVMSLRLKRPLSSKEVKKLKVGERVVSHAEKNFPNDQYTDGTCLDTTCLKYPKDLPDLHSKKKISRVRLQRPRRVRTK